MRKLLIFVLAVSSMAQQPIRVSTRLVQVIVVARDKHGVVVDLSKSDFEILDKGKPRQIATFSVAHASSRVAGTARQPGVFTNKLSAASESPTAATVVLFDFLNTGLTDIAYAREEILRFLKSTNSVNPVAVYILGNSLRIVQDFTEDHERLIRSMEKLPSQNSTLFNNSTNLDLPSLNPNASDPVTNGSFSNPTVVDSPSVNLMAVLNEPLQLYSLQRRVAMTLAALEAISNRLSGVPGRKNLIWVSGGFPLALAFDGGGLNGVPRPGGAAALGANSANAGTITFAAEMLRAAVAIDRANVAVYPVDARGLRVGGSIRMVNQPPYNQAAIGRSSRIPEPEDFSDGREVDTMRLLASWTGGKAFVDSNNIRGAVMQATEDSEVTYSLGFYAEEKELDGKYHELKVKVARKGIDLRHRQGYFATKLPDLASPTVVETLRNELSSPVDATGIGLTAGFQANPGQNGSYLMTITVDVRNLVLEERNSKWVGGVSFMVVQQEPSGNVLDTTASSITLNITEEDRLKLMQSGVTVSFAIQPAPGLSQIRVAVVDQGSGNVGSLRVTPTLQVSQNSASGK
jgi:VWFA-related protein